LPGDERGPSAPGDRDLRKHSSDYTERQVPFLYTADLAQDNQGAYPRRQCTAVKRRSVQPPLFLSGGNLEGNSRSGLVVRNPRPFRTQKEEGGPRRPHKAGSRVSLSGRSPRRVPEHQCRGRVLLTSGYARNLLTKRKIHLRSRERRKGKVPYNQEVKGSKRESRRYLGESGLGLCGPLK